jgi:dTDP-glucose 4,6-dehydratase
MSQKEDREFKNILITGGCGFIGTNFIRYLLEECEFQGRVVNVDKLNYAGNPENLIDIASNFPNQYVFVKADIYDRKDLAEILDEREIDGICHFAAESHVDRSILDPDAFIRTNIIGTYHLLELSRERRDRIHIFHHVSTDEVFGSLGSEGLFTEETSYRPNSPYSASKAASDHLVRAYHNTYNLPVTISNCSNNYGPYQFPEKLIPLMILNAKEGKPLPVYGDGLNVRDWLYVRDHCVAIWSILQKGKTGETYNIGGNCEMNNLHVVEIVCDILDQVLGKGQNRGRRELITFVKDRPGHDRRYAIDSSKIKKELQWMPAETFESGIRKTISWYLQHQEWINHVRKGEYQSWVRKQYG